MSLLYLPIGVALLVVSLAGATVALASTLALRRLWGPDVTPDLKELANQTARRLGALFALILALAFNTALSEHTELEEAIDEEAILVAQILEDAVEEMGEADSRAVISDLSIYVDEVVNTEWKAQSAASVSREADAALERVRSRLQNLEADQPDMVAETDALIDQVERRRLQRLLDLEQTLPPIFWILSVLLFFVTLVPTAYFEPSRSAALLLGTYGAAVCIVLYSILLLSEPFRSSMPVSDEPFRLVQTYLEEATK